MIPNLCIPSHLFRAVILLYIGLHRVDSSYSALYVLSDYPVHADAHTNGHELTCQTHISTVG